MITEKLKGTGTALITPFDADGAIDFEALERLIEFNIEGGVDYLVSLGTTGEAVTLSREECQSILDFTLEKVNDRVPVVFGVFGANNTDIVLERLTGYRLSGVTALLSASPYYNKPTQEGIFRHYQKIAEHSDYPIIIYNVPSRTASNITAETTLRIAEELPTIIGTKEASGNLDQINQILKYRPDNFLVLSGDDSSTLAMMAHGADGVISVISNAYPHEWSEMVRACQNQNFQKAAELYALLQDIHPWLYIDGNPCGIKGALRHLGIINTMEVRLPLVPMQPKNHNRLIQEMEKLKQTV